METGHRVGGAAAAAFAALLLAGQTMAAPTISGASAQFHRWTEDTDRFYELHPELQGSTGWRYYQQFKWFQEQRMFEGELPPPGARWLVVQEKTRFVTLRSSSTPWVALGPNRAIFATPPDTLVAGRMLGIAFHPTNPSVLYVASAGGGVWKSTDGGSTWLPKTDQIGVLAVGGIAVSRTDPNVVVIGTGEGTLQTPDRISGVGILRSINGGDTWQTTSLSYLVSQGHGFHFVEAGPSPGTTFLAGATDGLWRSSDSGATWQQVQSGVNIYDAKWKPGSSDVVYATQGNATSGNGVKISNDAGVTWSLAGTGQPVSTAIGKTKIAVCPSDPQRIYALYSDPGVERDSGNYADAYVSTDGGQTWASRAQDITVAQGNYDLVLAVNPADASTLLAGGQSLFRSTDGGWTFPVVSPAPLWFKDHHALAYEPGSSAVWIANDDGISRSTDDGQHWTTKNDGLATFQLWDMAVNNGPTPYWAVGGVQDNASIGREGHRAGYTRERP